MVGTYGGLDVRARAPGSDERTDGEIVDAVRDGDGAAFTQLYQRHVVAARRLARSMMFDRTEADDVVSEVFAATLSAIRRGRGPRDEVGPYVMTSIRRECRRAWRRGGRQRSAATDAGASTAAPDEFAATDEHAVLVRALAELSPRFRDVLWQTEVIGMSHSEIAAESGSNAVAVAQLATRARRALAERYLEAHLAGAVSPACSVTRSALAEVVRGTACRRRRDAVAGHLAECSSCRAARDDLTVVNARLRTGLPLALLPSITLARPAGLLARLAAWITGPAASLSTAAALAVVIAAVPAPAPRAAAASSPSRVEVVDVEPVVEVIDQPARTESPPRSARELEQMDEPVPPPDMTAAPIPSTDPAPIAVAPAQVPVELAPAAPDVPAPEVGTDELVDAVTSLDPVEVVTSLIPVDVVDVADVLDGVDVVAGAGADGLAAEVSVDLPPLPDPLPPIVPDVVVSVEIGLLGG